MALEVTATGDTSLSNRTVLRSSAPPAGLIMYFMSTDTYVQASSANRPADTSTGDDAAPADFTALTTVAQSYDAGSDATAAGRSGDFCKLLLSVSSTATYTGGAGSAIVLPSLSLGYDEA